MSGLLISVIANNLPVAAARENLTTESRTFEAATFEDYGAPIAVGTLTDMAEGLHVALEMEQEL